MTGLAPPLLRQASGDAYLELVDGLSSSESAITLPFGKQGDGQSSEQRSPEDQSRGDQPCRELLRCVAGK